MAQQRRGLGKGLGALIPEASRTDHGAVGAVGTAQIAAEGRTSDWPFEPVGVPARVTQTAGSARSRAPISRKSRSTRSPPIPASPAGTSTKTRWTSWPPPSPRSASCSRSSCGSWALAITNWSWASAACAHHSEPVLTTSRPSSARRKTTTCSATPSSRTSIASSSTRWRKQRPTGSCLTTSAQRTSSSRSASAAPARTSATPFACSACRPPCRSASPPASSARATPARCSHLDDPLAQERLAQRIVAEGLSVRTVEEIVPWATTGRGHGHPEGRHDQARGARPPAPLRSPL